VTALFLNSLCRREGHFRVLSC